MKPQTILPGFFRLFLPAMLIAAAATAQSAQALTTDKKNSHARLEPLQLTYIANEGVMVSAGSKKAMIDALFKQSVEQYRAPSPEIIDKIMKGEPPYDGIDLLMVTHNHPDHFDPLMVARYMETFTKTVLLAPADAAEELRKAAVNWDKIASRVAAFDLKPANKEQRVLDGIPVTAMRTKHSGDLESPMNFMYLFELDGWRIFHEGDSPGKIDDYRHFGLGNTTVHLALVHFWFPLEPGCAAFLQETLKPEHIALMHLPIRLESDAPGKIDLVRKYYKDIFLLLPGMPDKVFMELKNGSPSETAKKEQAPQSASPKSRATAFSIPMRN